MLRIGPQCWGVGGVTIRKLADAGWTRKLGTQMKVRARLVHSGIWNTAEETYEETEALRGCCSNREDRGSAVKQEQPDPTLRRDGWHQW